MESRQSESAFARLTPWAGIAFAVLFVAGFFVTGTTPQYDDAEAWQEWVDDSGNQWGSGIGGLMMVAGVLALIWYSQGLAWKLKSDTSPLAQVASSAATVMAAMIIAAVIFGIAVPMSILVGDAPVPSSDIPIQFEQVAFGLLLVGALWTAAVFVAAITTLARGIWPKWLIWVGYVLAVVMLFGVLFIPLVALPLWALISGIYLLRRPL